MPSAEIRAGEVYGGVDAKPQLLDLARGHHKEPRVISSRCGSGDSYTRTQKDTTRVNELKRRDISQVR